MKSIKTVYKIGHGPSSSHTVGPYVAAEYFLKRTPEADAYEVTLYGSLAFTGDGHGTIKAIESVMPNVKITLDTKKNDLPHPNTMRFVAFQNGTAIDEKWIYSIGGGAIRVENENSDDEKEVYDVQFFSDVMKICAEKNLTLIEYIKQKEGSGLMEYLRTIWHAMERCLEHGLQAEGVLPGGLLITRKAKMLYNTRTYNESSDIAMDRTISAYSYAVCEENASESLVVTAPTCGSCGIIPAVFYYMRHDKGYPEDEILEALAVAGLIGNFIRTNASVSGAECGCQAEVGSACSMAAAGLAHLYGLNISQIEYAAEVAMEHHLGLTCDPVNGLVQIPCIERNAVAAMRAINSVNLSRFLYQTRRISFDEIVNVMYRTGKDLNEKYRETSHGGLAVIHKVGH